MITLRDVYATGEMHEGQKFVGTGRFYTGYSIELLSVKGVQKNGSALAASIPAISYIDPMILAEFVLIN